MSKTYRVFLGAPSIADIQRDITSYSWRTFSSSSSSDTTPLSKKSTRLALQADQTLGVISQTEAISASNGSAVEDVDAPVRSQVQSTSVILPVDLLETASERISMIYKDATFGVEESDDEELAQAGSGRPMSEENEEKEVEISVFHGAGMVLVNFRDFLCLNKIQIKQIRLRCIPGLQRQRTRQTFQHLE